ncbi:MAG TPA: HAD-IA family hydrolase, partial [Burkholderiales bacterium]|nr:HAD-IA family hydrolase [Burkholderiales bacterium]
QWKREYVKPSDFDDLVAELHREKTKRYVEILEGGKIPMRPGVERLMREAMARGIRLAIATTTTPENVTALLKCSLSPDSEKWFEVIAAGDIVPKKKPAPDIYFWAMEKLGLPAQSCIAVEDSENGIRSSLGAGLKTVITVSDYTRNHDFSGAAAVLSDLGEPDSPFDILKGEAFGKTFADIDLLERWHA